MTAPTLVILAGVPYSGKSTLAGVLARRGFGIVEVDDINRERGFDIAQGVAVPEWPETFARAEQRLDALVAEGFSRLAIVWANPTRSDRDRWRRYGTDRGLRPYLVWLECSATESLRRRSTASDTRHRLSPQVIERLMRRLQPPADDEDALLLDAGEASPEVLADRVEDLTAAR